PSIEPAGTVAPSPPNALYIGRRGGGSSASDTFLATGAFDLGPYDRATLSFRYWMSQIQGGSGFGQYDRFFVEASIDGGLTFPVLLHQDRDWFWNGTDSASLPGKKWEDVRIDLRRAGLLVPDVAFRFRVLVSADEPAAGYID